MASLFHPWCIQFPPIEMPSPSPQSFCVCPMRQSPKPSLLCVQTVKDNMSVHLSSLALCAASVHSGLSTNSLSLGSWRGDYLTGNKHRKLEIKYLSQQPTTYSAPICNLYQGSRKKAKECDMLIMPIRNERQERKCFQPWPLPPWLWAAKQPATLPCKHTCSLYKDTWSKSWSEPQDQGVQAEPTSDNLTSSRQKTAAQLEKGMVSSLGLEA